MYYLRTAVLFYLMLQVGTPFERPRSNVNSKDPFAVFPKEMYWDHYRLSST